MIGARTTTVCRGRSRPPENETCRPAVSSRKTPEAQAGRSRWRRSAVAAVDRSPARVDPRTSARSARAPPTRKEHVSELRCRQHQPTARAAHPEAARCTMPYGNGIGCTHPVREEVGEACDDRRREQSMLDAGIHVKFPKVGRNASQLLLQRPAPPALRLLLQSARIWPPGG
jgi:hypothetical protein